MASPLKQKILEAEDIRSELVEVPEWDVTLKMTGLTGAQRNNAARRAGGLDGAVDLNKWIPELIIMSARDPENDELVFEPADRDALNNKASRPIQQLFDAVARLSGLSETAVEDAKASFEETPSEDSSSD